MSRSLLKNTRVYVDGYDMSGYFRSFGPLKWTFEEGVDDPLNAAVKGVWAGQANIGLGTINAMFDNTATIGTHARLATAGTKRTVMAVMGMEAAPVAYVPAFCGQFEQKEYITAPDQNPVAVTMGFDESSGASTTLLYANPWGLLYHPLGAETAANTATGQDYGATSTAFGGYMCYQITTSAGTGDITATLKIQDSDTNVDADFDDLITTGVINTGSGGVAVPTSGIVALSPTATVRQYTRWQLVLGTATSVTFALAFVRNLHN